MNSSSISYSALGPPEPIELSRLRGTPSSRSRQSSAELDRDDRLLLKSSKTLRSSLVEDETLGHIAKTARNIQQRLNGWRFGVLLSAALASFVLITNCAAAIVTSSMYGVQDGLSTVYKGDCSVVNAWSLGLHLVINALSSLLLSASNYTMQVLNAPTRAECDEAHARGDWLDIGITSLRNINRITRQRRILWVLLGLSSVPIHLLYNSAAFKTTDANSYLIVFATPEFLEPEFTQPPFTNSSDGFDHWNVSQPIRKAYLDRKSDFVHLSRSGCIDTYGVDFLTGYSDLIAITAPSTTTNSSVQDFRDGSVYMDGDSQTYSWMCSEKVCDPKRIKAKSSWTVGDSTIEYCLARKVESHCKLQFSRDILIAVIICNLCKAAAMIGALWLQRERSLVTTGDAISSWLARRDETTANQCMANANDIACKKSYMRLPVSGAGRDGGQDPIAFNSSKTKRWHHAIKRRRWATVLTLCTVTLAVAGLLLKIALYNLIEDTENTVQSTGFGAIRPGAIVDIGLPSNGNSALLANVLIANLPQLIFSCLFLLYNGLFTSMCLAHEYSSYSIIRRPLRVTSPQGKQRSTHWLHLPYFYSIPLLAASALLHWSISQSIFFVGIDLYDGDEFDSLVGLGFSIQPIILDIVLGSCMLFVVVGMGFRKLHGKMPLASSNSMAISAACHRPDEDADAAVKPLMWGEVFANADSEVGHCTFTSMEVTVPVEGKMYAGIRRRVAITD